MNKTDNTKFSSSMDFLQKTGAKKASVPLGIFITSVLFFITRSQRAL